MTIRELSRVAAEATALGCAFLSANRVDRCIRALALVGLAEEAGSPARFVGGNFPRKPCALLHPNSAASLVENVRRRMSRMPVGAVYAMFRCFDGLRYRDIRSAAYRTTRRPGRLIPACHSII
jgi:hypothetical protein